MNALYYLPGVYASLWFLTAKAMYRPMMRKNLDTFHLSKWCRYHGVNNASEYNPNKCCGTRNENSHPYSSWAVALFSMLIAIAWPVVWLVFSITYDPRKSGMKYLGSDRNGVRVSVTKNTRQSEIERLEKALGIGDHDQP